MSGTTQQELESKELRQEARSFPVLEDVRDGRDGFVDGSSRGVVGSSWEEPRDIIELVGGDWLEHQFGIFPY